MADNLFNFTFKKNNPYRQSPQPLKKKHSGKIVATSNPAKKIEQPKFNGSSHFTLRDGPYYLEAEIKRKEGKLKQGFLMFKKDVYSGTLSLRAGGGLIKHLRAYILNQEGKEITLISTKFNTTHSFLVDCKDLTNNVLRVICEAKIKAQGARGYKHLKTSVMLKI